MELRHGLTAGPNDLPASVSIEREGDLTSGLHAFGANAELMDCHIELRGRRGKTRQFISGIDFDDNIARHLRVGPHELPGWR